MLDKWKWYIYIIQCKDDSYYTGMTWCLEDRINQHASGLGGEYTKKHGFDKLVYIEEYDNFDEVRAREKQIKGWARKKKEKLINGEWTKEYI